MKKFRFSALLLVALTCLNSALYSQILGNLTYVVNDGEVTITDCFTSASGSLVIPDEIEELPVTAIGNGAFAGCVNLTSITIPTSVTSIGNDAFNGATSLTSVTIPASVTTIGARAFGGATSLTSVTIPDSVTTLGERAFEGATGLTSVTLSSNVAFTTIQSGTFSGCSGLTTITIPSNVTTISEYAFFESGLTSISIPASVTSIGEGAFSGNAALTSVTLTDGLVSIGDRAFSSTTSLTSITLPNTVTSLGERVFEGTTALTSVTLSTNVAFTNIQSATFSGSSALTSITIPENVTTIGDYAFFQSGLTSLAVPISITSIGEGAFSGSSALTSLTFPVGSGETSSLASIGESAFADCTGLTTVALPANVTSIGARAFSGSSALTSITLNDALTSIGEWAFADCTSLASIVVPSGVTAIQSGTFARCTGLAGIFLPDGITSIGSEAFVGCTALENIEIPGTVTSVGARAFADCSALRDVTIPASVTQFGASAFNGCSSLIRVLFAGDAPSGIDGTTTTFDGASGIFIVNFLTGASGFTTEDTWFGYPIKENTALSENPNLENAAPALTALSDLSAEASVQISFTATATDDGVTGRDLIYSINGAPAGASIDSATGLFTWTPSSGQAGSSYSFSVEVDDGELTDFDEISIIVFANTSGNSAPSLTQPADATIEPFAEYTFTAAATDDGIPSTDLVYSLVDGPEGASINSETGVFTWTPTAEQSGSVETFSVEVNDGELTDSKSLTLTVSAITLGNTSPVLEELTDIAVVALAELSFTASATDSFVPAGDLVYSLDGEPTGAAIDASTGEFTWTPSAAQGGVSYTFSVVVTDGELSDKEEITVTVGSVTTGNEPPALAAIGDQATLALAELVFTASATDLYLVGDALVYSLVDAPDGAVIDSSTGVFTWTPTALQAGSDYTFTVSVTDGELTGSEEITVTVTAITDGNEAPVLDTLDDLEAVALVELSFTASATDLFVPASSLVYSLDGEPAGAVIDSITGDFNWTPTAEQAGASYAFTVEVSDGELTDTEEITVLVRSITLGNESPVLAAIGAQSATATLELSFTATAADMSLVGQELAYSLVGAPTGATIDSATGVFTWTPGLSDAGGEFTFTVSVTDGELTDSEEITVTVAGVTLGNTPPILEELTDQSGEAFSEITFTATAMDSYVVLTELLYILIDEESTGASIDPTTGEFAWTPSASQAGGSYTFSVIVWDGELSDTEEITITVGAITEGNVPPVLEPVGDRSVEGLSEFLFTAVASDLYVPASSLVYSLVDAPTGAAIDSQTGEFTWTPSLEQVGEEFTFTVVVSDGELTDTEEVTFTVATVTEGNDAPVLGALVDLDGAALSELTFTAAATDDGVPGNGLTYSLVNRPAGAYMNSLTGEFVWTPTLAQDGQSYTFSVVVSDGERSDSAEITLTIAETTLGNTPPVLETLFDLSAEALVETRFVASATDDGLVEEELVFSLVGEPSGATIDSAAGVFTWTPSASQSGRSYSFTVVVNDGELSDSQEVTIQVLGAPVVAEKLGGGVSNLGNSWYWLSWFGAFAEVSDDWVYSENLGYLFISPTGSSEGVWLYSTELESWLWGGSELNGFYFDHSAQSWVWVLPVEGAMGSWLLNMTTQTWTQLSF